MTRKEEVEYMGGPQVEDRNHLVKGGEGFSFSSSSALSAQFERNLRKLSQHSFLGVL